MSPPRSRRRRLPGSRPAALVLIGAAVLGVGAAGPPPPTPAPPPDPTQRAGPAAGRFLVATRQIQGSIFFESVVFVMQYGAGGAMGLIVNQPSEIDLSEVLPGVRLEGVAVHVGGPVDRRSMMYLLRADVAPERAAPVVEDLFVSSDPGLLRELVLAPDAGERLRVYAGYAGWVAGQLDREIARGDWIVVRAPTGAIFDAAPGALWKRLYRENHRLQTRAPRPALVGTFERVARGLAGLVGAAPARRLPSL